MVPVTSEADIDDLDREILNAVQWDFPLEPRPFAVLAERLGIDEPTVRERVQKVKDAGVLRQLSAIFDTRALGYTSALVAAKVDPDHIDEAAAVISEHPGVSHNYKRNHDYNLWYTVAVPPGESLDEHVDVLHRESGATVTRKLPTITLYKIGVKLDMTGQTAANAKAEVLEHERPERKAEMPAPDLSDFEHAAITVVQQDLPVVERPFAAYAKMIGDDVTEDDVQHRRRRNPTRSPALLRPPLGNRQRPIEGGRLETQPQQRRSHPALNPQLRIQPHPPHRGRSRSRDRGTPRSVVPDQKSATKEARFSLTSFTRGASRSRRPSRK
jgi:DNA-binding Lrp family transcriptional regulator